MTTAINSITSVIWRWWVGRSEVGLGSMGSAFLIRLNPNRQVQTMSAMNTKVKIGLAGVVLLAAAYFAMVYTTRHEPGISPSLATSKTTATPTAQVAQPVVPVARPS